jgi:hypothetical protein
VTAAIRKHRRDFTYSLKRKSVKAQLLLPWKMDEALMSDDRCCSQQSRQIFREERKTLLARHSHSGLGLLLYSAST